ncbi:DUF4362 domain-containing protein [Paractinoplanes globisporus]|uniref:DUF4362 domain-containing protein n=1 Tax=Paractinoplanes globisporus TaxID=113565 RepID=A0ABW6WCV1_9ACTN|nr:DUF4362 domain-containing protein [Actinoplanes globisporus]
MHATRILTAALAASALGMMAACANDASEKTADARETADAGQKGAPGPVDCGTFVLGQGEKLPAGTTSCLLDAARAGRPAQLRVTRPTTEGDPIPFTYTVRTDGKIELVTDTRQDKFGPQRITRDICTGPAATPYGIEFASCVPE